MIKFNLQLFGGRGSSSGGVSARNVPLQNLREVPLDEAIGVQGAAQTLTEAANNVNMAFYAADGYTPGTNQLYQVNCQRCVIAQELRQRGYNVVARPSTGPGDPMPYSLTRQSWTRAFVGMTTQYVTSGDFAQGIANIMAQWGDGARAIVRFGRAGGAGHVFSAEQINGRTYFVDPQTGRAHDGAWILRHAISVGVSRVDNLDMNPAIIGLAVQQA